MNSPILNGANQPMTPMPRVQILLATYNGEKFLEEQLASIAAQTYPNWQILARDDGSTDRTLAILKRFQAQYPNKLMIVDDGQGSSGGAAPNFIKLMLLSDGAYVSFADQDDIWHPEKIERSVKEMLRQEEQHGVKTPIMVHHDFTMVDENKGVLCKSFDAAHGKKRSENTPERMPFRGYAHGFSMLMNKALIDKTLPAPITLGHDTLVACVAQDFGKISYIPEQLAQYRRHGSNSSAVVSYPRRLMKKLLSGEDSAFEVFSKLQNAFVDAKQNLRQKCMITAAYLDRYGDDLAPKRKETLTKFSGLEDLTTLERKALLLRYSAESPRTALLASLTL